MRGKTEEKETNRTGVTENLKKTKSRERKQPKMKNESEETRREEEKTDVKRQER